MFNVFVERLVTITRIQKPSSYLGQCFQHSMTLFPLYWAFRIELSEAQWPTRYLYIQNVLVPYPIMKILDDKFQLYLDFHLVAETTSYTTALALLLSTYHVFEIRFAHHNRCVRLLYGIIFEDAHYLDKALKTLLNNWKYKIVSRPLVKRRAVVTNLVQNLTQSSVINENISSPSNIFNHVSFVI